MNVELFYLLLYSIALWTLSVSPQFYSHTSLGILDVRTTIQTPLLVILLQFDQFMPWVKEEDTLRINTELVA